MTMKIALVTPCLALYLGAVSTGAAAPPVKVEVVIDEEDQEDFFVEEASTPKTKVQQIKEHADALFDELEQEEIAHGKRAPIAGKDGQQKSNQVVNVIVMGEKQKAGTPDTPAVPDTPDRPLTKRELRLLERKQRLEERRKIREMKRKAKLERIRAKLAYKREKLKIKREKLALKEEHRAMKLEHRGWWNRPSWASQGDLLIHGQAGLNGLGVFGGVGAEYMASNVFGLRFGATFAHVDGGDAGDDAGPNFDFSEGGVWANQQGVDDSLESGRAQLIDTSLAFHVIPQSRFDIYPSVGFGYMGYQFDYDDHREKGGAGYLRVGAGFNIVIKRFYGGLDFGWYPYELFRHGGGDAVARSEAGLRSSNFATNDGSNDGGSPAPASVREEGGGRFDPQRMMLTAHVGLRF